MNFDLREVIKSNEFKNYWATKQVKKNWRVTATKKSITVWYDYKRREVYAKFTFKEWNDEELDIHELYVVDGWDETISSEFDYSDTVLELAKGCMYHFTSRY